MKLLIVDEDQHFCGIIATVLENDGHEVVPVGYARGALSVLGTVLPDVVLVSAEVAGPGGGVQLLRDLRRHSGGESATTILMTNYADDAVRRGCAESRTEHVLVRPFSVLDLASLVRSLDVPQEATPESSPAQGNIDLHNLTQCVRLWASASSGTLSVERVGRAERILVTGGGLVDPGALVNVRDALFGADMEFHAHDPVGVGDRRAFGQMLFRESEAHEGNRTGEVTRAAVISRTRFTDAVRELPVSAAVRQLTDQLGGPVAIGALCDRVGVDFPAVASSLGALAAMGLLSVQPAAAASWSHGASRPSRPFDPDLVIDAGRPHGSRPTSGDRAPSNPPGRERPASGASSYRDRPVSVAHERPRSNPPDRPWSTPSTADRPRSVVPAERPLSVPLEAHEARRPGSVSEPVAAASSPKHSLADQIAMLRRLRREVDLLRGSDPWVVLAVSHDAPPERIEQASQRMVARYESLAAQWGGEVADLSRQLLQRVRDATLELTRPPAIPSSPKALPGDEYFQAGLRAMSEGDWAGADRRFTAARDAHLDSVRNLAHLGWARFHNPELPLAERVEEGIDLLLLAEQLDPTYAEGQYFLAMVLHRKGDDDAASRRVRRALKAEPQHVAANALAKKLRKPPVQPP